MSGDPAEDSKAVLSRRKILDAAAHVLSTKGYAGFRLIEVAALAELQPPAIYHYFSSREDLIQEVMVAGTAQVREHVMAVLNKLPTDTSALDRLMAAVEAHLRQELDISDYSTAAIRNAGQVPTAIRLLQIQEEEHYGEVWRGLINELARAGHLRPDLDLYLAQMLTLGALNWAAEWWDPRRGSLNAVVTAAQSYVRHALAEPGSP